VKADVVTEEALSLLVERFYERVREDASLGPVFDGASNDWPKHLERLTAFWSSVMLTSGRYKGRPLPAHLKHAEAMTPEHFERWLALWEETASELFAPEPASAFVAKAQRIAESLSLGVRFARGMEAAA
jgi:hemoglobin